VSIEFDDGWKSSYLLGLPTVESFGWRPTAYVPTDWLVSGDPDFMTPAQLVDWNRRGDVGSHTVTHPDLTTVSSTAIRNELTASKNYLDTLLGEPTKLLATPYCATNATVVSIAKTLYQSSRDCDGTPNTKANWDPYDLKCFLVEEGTTDAEITSLLNQAKTSKGWLILGWHAINGDDPTNAWSVSQARLQHQLQLVKNSGIQVVTTQQALNESLGL
jgi:peptidoglycan/xylan/chitin deacetylase (PgdA/CDA1 family)